MREKLYWRNNNSGELVSFDYKSKIFAELRKFMVDEIVHAGVLPEKCETFKSKYYYDDMETVAKKVWADGTTVMKPNTYYARHRESIIERTKEVLHCEICNASFIRREKRFHKCTKISVEQIIKVLTPGSKKILSPKEKTKVVIKKKTDPGNKTMTSRDEKKVIKPVRTPRWFELLPPPEYIL